MIKRKLSLFLFFIITALIYPFLSYSKVEISSSLSIPQEYLEYIRKKIDFFFFYPQEAEVDKIEGIVKVRTVLNSAGEIREMHIITSSGFQLLDNVAQWTINNSSPFPPLPTPLKETEMIITMHYKTNIHQEETISISPKNSDHPILSTKTKSEPKKINPQEYNEYIESISNILNFYLLYPQEAKEKGYEGTVDIKFNIDYEGKVINPQIIKSSGYPILDKAALLTLDIAQPFPYPPHVTDKTIEITLPLNFKIEKIPSFKEELALTKSIEKEEKYNKEKLDELSLEEKFTSLTFLKDKEEINKLYQIAKNNYQPLKIAESQLKLSMMKVKEAMRNLFPALGIEYNSTTGETITDTYKSKSYGAKAQHILYDSGQRGLSLKRERLNVEVAKNNYEKVRNELIFELLKSYYIFLNEHNTLSVLEDAYNKFKDYLTMGNTLQEAKLITQIEYLKIQNLTHKLEAYLAAQQSRYNLSIANLKKVLGINPDEKIPQITFIDFKENIPLENSISVYINMGIRLRPEIALWEKTLKASELAYRITKVENRPKLLLESFWGRSGEAYGYQNLELANNWNIVGRVIWLFGGSSFETSLTKEKTVPTEIAEVSTKTEADTLSLKMNLLDKFRYYTETQESKIALKQAEDELIKLKKDIAWEVQDGYFTYTEAQKRITSIKKELETYSKELELKKELLRADEMTISDVMEIELRSIETTVSLLRAKLDMYLGLITLDKATGFNINIVKEL
ncbi:MAG: TonB family protein [Candidatus Omnitrophica bacterium]|nr:TonB family protein [Candidatus Omnitrophota bacterium]MCM8827067.1 TonB family protein [Candidatus Omnitrophota bacterium]